MIGDLRRLIEQVSRDKGIDKDLLLNTVMEAVRSAAKKRYGAKQDNIEVGFSEDTGEIEVFQFKEVVDEVIDSDRQITLPEARQLDPECDLGDSLGIKLDAGSFGRIAAQSAKQVIIQGMRDAERDIVFEDYKDRKGEIINGIVQRQDKSGIIVNLGRTEALLPITEQVPRELYRQGDRIRAYVVDVKRQTKGPQIILSRVDENFLIMLFEAEVPEIQEGIVKIMAVAREPGSRSKIAVASRDADVDPVGACVGMKGSRVQNIVQELRGEKIDIIPWNPDPAKFVTQALAPAEVSRIIIDEDSQNMEIIVPDDQLFLAIGKRGQNVRLAAKLTGWKIDVKSESKYSKSMKEGYLSLLKIPGVGEMTASALYEAGFTSAKEVAEANLAELMQVPGINEKKATQILGAAQTLMKASEDNPETTGVEEIGNLETGSNDVVQDADQV
ncbi:transcription termination factor NusA [Desulfobacca acetoxidans]|uniref:Transcription termination/antitermination protein NusA n=1 Tax=Desulfobacca acetoxidans (strain ATCC 700848 / DSM 11109 / ASRB2) TaxID=880072 RepID=F2NFJ1_DESAR|nr:transcription termination factor NusA [Desulfobacca acetoxidans]AEB10110.1 NusA antitermination factor [Desulfobacca acetoxidans DSM 11109]HAY22537.1 transcription termination/antitermination protein NusA [Desulfobacterales bacterium]